MENEATIKAEDVKAGTLSHMLYQLKYEAAITEYGGIGCKGIADVFAVRPSGFTHEFEVKVDKGDLAGELLSIEILEPTSIFGYAEKNYLDVVEKAAKLDKHVWYLERKPPGEWGFARFEIPERKSMTPNQFTFVVSEDLVEQAKAGVKGTPYGVFKAKMGRWGVELECVVKAGYLHKDKPGEDVMRNMFRKAATEVESLRRQVAAGKRCTSCRGDMPKRCEPCEGKLQMSREYRKESNKRWAEESKKAGITV